MKRLFLLAAIVLIAAHSAWAAPITKQIPMTFQTTSLTPDKSYNFTFSIWDGAGDAASRLWVEGPTAIWVQSDGTITHSLGRLKPFTSKVTFAKQLWVQWTGGDETQRVRMQVVPYAMFAVDGPPGPQGPRGDTGPQGPMGPQGPAGVLPAISCPRGECLTGIDASGSAVCMSCQLNVYADAPFEFVPTPKSWADAKVHCEGNGGHLATVSSLDENQKLYALGSGLYDLAWLGGYQPGGACEPACGWEWITGELFSAYLHWFQGPPTVQPDNGQVDEDCLSILGVYTPGGISGGFWNDAPCSWQRQFFCEY